MPSRCARGPLPSVAAHALARQRLACEREDCFCQRARIGAGQEPGLRLVISETERPARQRQPGARTCGLEDHRPNVSNGWRTGTRPRWRRRERGRRSSASPGRCAPSPSRCSEHLLLGAAAGGEHQVQARSRRRVVDELATLARPRRPLLRQPPLVQQRHRIGEQARCAQRRVDPLEVDPGSQRRPSDIDSSRTSRSSLARAGREDDVAAP